MEKLILRITPPQSNVADGGSQSPTSSSGTGREGPPGFVVLFVVGILSLLVLIRIFPKEFWLFYPSGVFIVLSLLLLIRHFIPASHALSDAQSILTIGVLKSIPKISWKMPVIMFTVAVIGFVVSLVCPLPPTPVPSDTPTPTSGSSVLPTDTPLPSMDTPTATPTDAPTPTDTLIPTDTPLPPIDTPTPTDMPTAAATPTPTDTPLPSIDTPTPADTPTPTDTPLPPTDTPTATPIDTPTPTNTLTSTVTPTLVSPKGKIAFVSDRDGDAEIFSMDENGNNLRQLTYNTVGDRHPSWSPDGTQIAFTRDGHGAYPDIYVMNADGSDQRPLVTHHASDMWPAWSLQGDEWIAFQTNRNGNWDIYLVRSDGTDLHQLTTHSANDEMPAWSADGCRVFFQSERGRVAQIYSIDIAAGEPAEHHVASGFSYQFPRPSPQDGRLAFGSPDQDGNPEIYIEVDGQARRVTDAGSEEKTPIWSPDGQKIAFVSTRDGPFNIYVVLLDEVLSAGAGRTAWNDLVIGPGNNEDPAWWRPK